MCVRARCLSENNQTASIGNLRRQHEGLYRCTAYGHGGDVLSNEVKLVAQGQDKCVQLLFANSVKSYVNVYLLNLSVSLYH